MIEQGTNIINFDSISEIFKSCKGQCKYCGDNNLYVRDIIYEIEPDRTPLVLGKGGCGGK